MSRLIEAKKLGLKYQTDIILVIGVILISLLSFAGGYIIAKKDVNSGEITVQEPEADACQIGTE